MKNKILYSILFVWVIIFTQCSDFLAQPDGSVVTVDSVFNNTDNTAKYSSNSRKVYAHCYIDDRNLGGFPGWDTVYRLITEAENEYKAKQITIHQPPITIH